jgi:hypothetical protein
MKLKASHHWLFDGTVVVEVWDHDAMKPAEKANPFSRKRHAVVPTRVHTMRFPRGTTKAAVKMAKQTAIMLYELKMNEVSR